MEIRAEGVEFEVYNKGGLNLKVLVIDLPQETVREPIQFRAEQGWTLLQLKTALAQVGVVTELSLGWRETIFFPCPVASGPG